MAADLKLITKLEVLARIELTPHERERLAPQLDGIIDYVRRLHCIDTTGVEPAPMSRPATIDALRTDEPVECLTREVVMGEAPDTDGKLYRVPRIIER